MNFKAAILSTVAAIDLLSCTVIFIESNFSKAPALFIAGAKHFNIYVSLFDLWCLSEIRSCLLLGLVIGCVKNPRDGPVRLAKVNLLFTALALASASYSCVKLLFVNEEFNSMDLPWLWPMFSVSMLFSLAFFICFRILSEKKTNETDESDEEEPTESRRRLEVVVGNTDDRTNLIDNDSIQVQSTSNGGSAEPKKSSAGVKTKKNKKGKEKDKKKDESECDYDLPASVAVRRLLRFSVPEIPLLCAAFLFLLCSASADIFLPYYTGKAIEGIAINKDAGAFTRAILTMTGISLFSALFAGLRGLSFSIYNARVNVRIRKYLFSSLIQQDIGFFDQVLTGDITSRLTSDTTTMSDSLGLNINVLLRSLVKAVGTCVFMFRLSWQLSLVTFLSLPVIVIISMVYGDYFQELQKKLQDSLAEVNNVAEEILSNMKTVRSFANELCDYDRYVVKLLESYRIWVREAKAYAAYIWGNESLGLGMIVATLLVQCFV